MTILATTTVAEIATLYPLSTRVFARHSVDFCCGGHEPLEETCQAKGLDLEAILHELESEISKSNSEQARWDLKPIPELIAHIIEQYHDPLPEELARIELMARKVHRVHGDKDQAMFDGILETFLAIRADIEPHLRTEEEVLFPGILAGRNPDDVMDAIENDHEGLGKLLLKMRAFAKDFIVPMEACNTWRALLVGLETLEGDLHRHIHLENHVLHPRARMASAG
ncbi:MAG: regulator of cell morphogenesis and NO signaling [Planctomycetota bacterium]|jgi:regulator of cell morphogenesis and NO signaling